MRTLLTPWLIGMAFTIAPVAASAQEAPTKTYPECTRGPTDAEVAAAKGAYQAGSASYDEADYARAIDYWEDAYRRDCTANALLLNLGRAYELSGRKRQAVATLETFLQREPSSPQKDQIQRRIEVLKSQLAQAPAPAPAAQPQPAVQAPPASSGQALPPAQEDEPPKSKRSLVPLIVAGAGGVLFIVGTAIYVPAANEVDEFESHCEVPSKRRGCPADEVSDANDATSKQDLGGGLMIGGAVVAVGGVVWYFLSPRKPATAAGATQPRVAQVAPAVGPGFAGLSLNGSF